MLGAFKSKSAKDPCTYHCPSMIHSFIFGDGYRISELCKLVSWSKNHPFMIVGEKNFPSHAKLTPGKYIWWHAVARLKSKFGRNYCHQNWWYFCYSKNRPFLQITKIFTKIGDKKKLKLAGIIVTRIGDIFVTQKLTNFFNSPKMSPKLVKNLAKIQ